MADHPSPVAAELAEARDLCLLPDAEQLELIRDGQDGRDPIGARIEAERRGRGRPRGALNKRNAKFREQLLALYGHPAEALARAAFTPVEQLAASLNCSRLEAAQLGIRAAAELLPYVEGKAPVQIDLNQRSDVVMIMAGAPGVGRAELDAIAERVNGTEGIDWESATFEDVAPFQLSGPEQSAPPEPLD